MKRSVFFLAPDLAGSFYRTWVPAISLRNAGYLADVDNAILFPFLSDYDTLVVWREFTPQAEMALDYANQNGILTVYDLDDDLWSIGKDHPGYGIWSQEAVIEGLNRCIAKSQQVSVSTQVLAKRVERINPRVAIVPNALPDWDWENVNRGERSGEKVVAGWAGSATHWKDLELLKGIALDLLEEFPQLELRLAGMESYPFPPHPRIRTLESVSIQAYPTMISQWDIGLAPLADSRFNESKSDLKVLEYSMASLGVVASDCPAYRGSIQPGRTGLLASSTDQWFENARYLIENETERLSISSQARSWAESRLATRFIDNWKKIYELD